MTEVLRTPDSLFENLSGFDFQPHYIELEDERFGSLRMHYLDEGDVDAPVILCLHGQATWCYSYRKMIPVFVAAGYRVIAPDFIGFGRSDKLQRDADYSFQNHIDWLLAFVKKLNIKNASGFFFDWGGYFGLPAAVELPEAFSSLILVNTTLPRAAGLINAVWVAGWRRYILKGPQFPIADMVDDMTDSQLTTSELAALNAPYPDESFKAGPRSFPMLIPATSLHPATKANRRYWQRLSAWKKPVLTLVSERLARRGFNPREFHRHIPGTNGQTHKTFAKAGFFIIEDCPLSLADNTVQFINQISR